MSGPKFNPGPCWSPIPGGSEGEFEHSPPPGTTEQPMSEGYPDPRRNPVNPIDDDAK